MQGKFQDVIRSTLQAINTIGNRIYIRINWKVFGTWGTYFSVAYGIIAINTASVSENTQKY